MLYPGTQEGLDFLSFSFAHMRGGRPFTLKEALSPYVKFVKKERAFFKSDL